MIRYLSVEQVVSLHQRIIGHLTDVGVRDYRALELAVLRPTTTFETEDLYSTLDAKAAALLHALATAPAFADAGRETALLAAECFLIANGATLHATDRELERVGAAVATGDMSADALAIWIRQRTGTVRRPEI
jgi:death on curing protein